MNDSEWNIDPGVSPPTRDDAWFPPRDPRVPGAVGLPPVPPTRSPESTPASSSPSLRRRGGPGRLVAGLVVGVVLAAAIGFVSGRVTSSRSPSVAVAEALGEAQVTKASAGAPAPLTGDEPEPVAAVANALSPAAVQLQGENDLGSGFIYDADGLILTAAHVVQGNSTMTVRLNDGTQVQGEVVGADESTDVAVVRIDVDRELPVAALGTGVPVEVGQMAVAVGSPYGLTQSVTSGIISAVGRTLLGQENASVALIQTDAPINPGNSGGMLANRKGQVIGVNDSIISGTESGSTPGNVGVGFAIPIDLAKSVADQLVAGKPVEFGFLGVQTRSADGSRVGGLIASVESAGPADEAGLQVGDVVVKVNDNPVASGTDLAAAIRASKPGDEVDLTVFRDGSETHVSVVLGRSAD